MVGTITPIGDGESRRKRSLMPHWLHTLGNVAGAAGLGGLLGALGAMLPWSAHRAQTPMAILLLTGCLCLLYSLRELGLVPVPAPQVHRQVPVWWQGKMRRQTVAVLYGLVLGSGLVTRVAVATLYAPVLWAVLSGRPGQGALVMSAFGLGRALPVLWFGLRGKTAMDTLPLFGPLTAWQPIVHLANGMALAVAGAALVVGGLATA